MQMYSLHSLIYSLLFSLLNTKPHSALNALTSALGDLCAVWGDAESVITIIKSMTVNMSLELSRLGINDRSVEM